jgi:glycerophosphoryl diester phosphodiesterase
VLKEKTGIWTTAHAGCLNTEMDSMDSVVAGIYAEADIIEVDVRLLPDGTAVLSHERIESGREKFLVRLEDVLTLVKERSQACLNLDLKKTEGVAAINRLLTKTDMRDRVFLTGVGPENVDNIQNNCGGIPYLLNYDPDAYEALEEGYSAFLLKLTEKSGAFGINLYYMFATKELVGIFHRAGKKVSVWTVDGGYEMSRMIDLGVDSITSRRVHVPARLFKKTNR